MLHFRDLAVFGEQLLLSIRFGAWTTVNDPEQAANWARYWRREVQRYMPRLPGGDRRRPDQRGDVGSGVVHRRCAHRAAAAERTAAMTAIAARGRSSTRTATPAPATGSPGRGTPPHRSTATCGAATRRASRGPTCSPRSTPTTPSANEEVGRIVAGRPGRFFGFAFVHAERDRGRILPMVRRAVDDFGFCGIKVHRHDARHQPRGLRGRPRGCGCRCCTTRWARSRTAELFAGGVPGRRLHHPAPGQLRRRLDAPSWRSAACWPSTPTSTPTPPACAASTCWCEAVRAGRAAQGAVRLGRPVAAPRRRAGEGAPAGPAADR